MLQHSTHTELWYVHCLPLFWGVILPAESAVTRISIYSPLNLTNKLQPNMSYGHTGIGLYAACNDMFSTWYTGMISVLSSEPYRWQAGPRGGARGFRGDTTGAVWMDLQGTGGANTSKMFPYCAVMFLWTQAMMIRGICLCWRRCRKCFTSYPRDDMSSTATFQGLKYTPLLSYALFIQTYTTYTVSYALLWCCYFTDIKCTPSYQPLACPLCLTLPCPNEHHTLASTLSFSRLSSFVCSLVSRGPGCVFTGFLPFDLSRRISGGPMQTSTQPVQPFASRSHIHHT